MPNAPDADETFQLPESWASLHAAQDGATPFMHPGWAGPWWRHYGHDARPLVIEVEGGIAPFVIRRQAGQRVVRPWGIEPGDYWDVLAPPGRREEVTRAAVAVLAARSREWDAVLLRCLPPDSCVQAALAESLVVGLSRPMRAPAIELPASFDDYLRTLSSGHRQNLRRHLRRLDSGEVTLREVTDAEELPATFDRWQAFRSAQWSSAGKAINPEHVKPRFRAFLLDVARQLVPVGQALVWEFSHQERVVGVYLNFADEHAFHWYLGGFDPAVNSLGLGKIAVGHGIRTSIEAGRARYDFGRGAEAYKYWYGAEDRMLGAVLAGSERLRSRAAMAAAKAIAARR